MGRPRPENKEIKKFLVGPSLIFYLMKIENYAILRPYRELCDIWHWLVQMATTFQIKKGNWSPKEDKTLTTAYIKISEDTRNGTNQSNNGLLIQI